MTKARAKRPDVLAALRAAGFKLHKRSEECSPQDMLALVEQATVIGHVIAFRATKQTFTVWRMRGEKPGTWRGEDLERVEDVERVGGEEAALVIVGDHGVSCLRNHSWRHDRWLTTYLEQLMHDIDHAGSLEAFVAVVRQEQGGMTAGTTPLLISASLDL